MKKIIAATCVSKIETAKKDWLFLVQDGQVIGMIESQGSAEESLERFNELYAQQDLKTLRLDEKSSLEFVEEGAENAPSCKNDVWTENNDEKGCLFEIKIPGDLFSGADTMRGSGFFSDILKNIKSGNFPDLSNFFKGKSGENFSAERSRG